MNPEYRGSLYKGSLMEINLEIKTYIEENIIPKYREFDKAHNLSHVNKVISNSLKIAQDYDVDMDQVYVIAAYHDFGLCQGRENHEKNSAISLLNDDQLKKWFNEEILTRMAQAVEDHRASNDYEPRSIYGMIVSESDRDIDYWTILTRTIQYSLKNYPDYDFEQHLERTYFHIKNKYGEGGYLKLWLATEDNQRNLQILREHSLTKEGLRNDFEKVYNECID